MDELECEDKLKLLNIYINLGITEDIVKGYEKIGLSKLYDWQYDCLFSTTLLRGENLIYFAPTSGGKTLVAELMLLKTVIDTNRIAIFVLPFVSLVNEKEKHFRRIVATHNRNRPKNSRIKIKGYFGEKSVNNKCKIRENILICTIEKVNGIINGLINRGQMGLLGCVAIDEMHVLGDSQRGYLLEILIRFLEHQAKEYNETSDKYHKILEQDPVPYSNSRILPRRSNASIRVQLIGLSATMGNVEELANWFGANLYRTTFRPVPLIEYVKAGNELLKSDGSLLCNLPPFDLKSNPDHIVNLCAQGLTKQQQILIFCPSRLQCENISNLLVSSLSTLVRQFQKTIPEGDIDSLAKRITHFSEKDKNFDIILMERKAIIEKMKESNGSLLNANLLSAILHGIAVHHAGLGDAERALIEDGYRQGVISILTATSTLAAGVNLPAGRVLIKSLFIGRELLGVIQYRQMCGRAGRAGKTNLGESFLLVRGNEKQAAMDLVKAPMPPVVSQMHPRVDGGRGLLKSILELHALGVCRTNRQTEDYIRYTLMYWEESSDRRERIVELARTSLNFLVNAKALSVFRPHQSQYHQPQKPLLMQIPFPLSSNGDDSKENLKNLLEQPVLESIVLDSSISSQQQQLRITRFGKAIIDSGLNPDEAIALYDDLLRAQESLNLETDLHLMYLITPIQHNLKPDFNKLWTNYESNKMKKSNMICVYDAIGIDEGSLFRWFRNPPNTDVITNCSDKLRLLRIQIHRISPQKIPQKLHQPNYNNKELSESEYAFLHRCRRLWAANALLAIVNGQSLASVAKSFDAPIGDLESLLQSTRLIASRVQRFCGEIGWLPLQKLIEDFKSKLDFNIPNECKDLMRIPNMTLKIAQAFVGQGILTVDMLSQLSVDSIAQYLQFQSTFEIQDLEVLEETSNSFNADVLSTSGIGTSSGDARGSRPRGGLDNHNERSSIPVGRDEIIRMKSMSCAYVIHQLARKLMLEDEEEAIDELADLTATLSRLEPQQRQQQQEEEEEEGVDSIVFDPRDNVRCKEEKKDHLVKKEILVNHTVVKMEVVADERSLGTVGEGYDDGYDDDEEEEDMYNEVEDEDFVGMISAMPKYWLLKASGDDGEHPQGVTVNDAPAAVIQRASDSKPNIYDRENVSDHRMINASDCDEEKRPFQSHLGNVHLESKIESNLNIEKVTEFSHEKLINPYDYDSRLYSVNKIEANQEQKPKISGESHLQMKHETDEFTPNKVIVTRSKYPIDLHMETMAISSQNAVHSKDRESIVPQIIKAEKNSSYQQVIESKHSFVTPKHGRISLDTHSEERLKEVKIQRLETSTPQVVKVQERKSAFVYDSDSAESESDEEAHRREYKLNIISHKVIQSAEREEYSNEEKDVLAQGALRTLDLKKRKRINAFADDSDEDDRKEDPPACHSSDVLLLKEEEKQPLDPVQGNILEQATAEVCDDCSQGYSLNMPSFRTPFTPSKTATPGTYMYLPQGQNLDHDDDGETERMESLVTFTGAADACNGSQGFGWKHLSNPLYAQEFLDELKKSACISFELLFRPIPIAQLVQSRSEASAFIMKLITQYWNPFLVSKNNKTNLMGSQPASERSIISGVAFCFGAEFGYYLPLPNPLPTSVPWKVRKNDGNHSLKTVSVGEKKSLTDLPPKCLQRISRFVGYHTILLKSPALLTKLYSSESRHYIFHSEVSDETYRCIYSNEINNYYSRRSLQAVSTLFYSRNPLLEVSKQITIQSRIALQYEWRRGVVGEWRLLADIVSNPIITKISRNIKDKLVVLRERDIYVRGPLQDPQVAYDLLRGAPDIPQLSTLLKSPTVLTQFSHQLSLCFQSISTFRSMAILTKYLHRCNCWDLFTNIEMPLCNCIASMEYHGMPIDTRFLNKLGQDLQDRKKTIEFYFQHIEGKDFNLSSTNHCNDLKNKILQECKNQDTYQSNQSNHSQAIKNQSNISKVDISTHPLLRLLSEYRTHSHLIPLCTSILASKHRFSDSITDRVRATVQALGTETGRLTISAPTLQHVPHECKYWYTHRPSFHDEINKYKPDYKDLVDYVRDMNIKFKQNQSEWVRVVSLNALRIARDVAIESDMSQSTCTAPENNEQHFLAYTPAKFLYLCPMTIDQPYLSQSSPDANTISQDSCSSSSIYPVVASGALSSHIPNIPNNTLSGPENHCKLPRVASLAELWISAGVGYTEELSSSILQVCVEISGHKYHYPADKVFRLAAPLRPSQIEIIALNHAMTQKTGPWKGIEPDETGKPPIDYISLNPRDGFRASRGYLLLSADYSQIELRIMSHFSKDINLIRAFQSGVDVFRVLTAMRLKKHEEIVTEQDRNVTKQLCYAIIYGAGPQLISDSSGCSVDDARKMFQDFLSKFPGISKFVSETKLSCRKLGYVETLLGRRRYLPEIRSQDSQKRSKAERQAVNTVCQGSAADLIKLAMINIENQLSHSSLYQKQHHRKKVFKCPGGALYHSMDEVRLVLQIHDELLFEIPEGRIEEVADIVRHCMEHAVVLDVPLQVKIKTGPTWGNLKLL